MRHRSSALALSAILGACACGSSSGEPGVSVYFDLGGDLSAPDRFFDHPFPSDLRLTAEGAPDVTYLPNPKGIAPVEDLRALVFERRGFPVMPVAYFRFDGPLAPRSATGEVHSGAGAPILLLDLEARSLVPAVAATLLPEEWSPDHTLAVAPRPGFVLRAGRPHAVVVMRALGDAAGAPLGVAAPIARLAAGGRPAGAQGEAVRDLFAPLWVALDELGVPGFEVAAATVFTTGDAVADLAELAEAVAAAHEVSLEDLALDPDDGADHSRFCELLATVSFPQFQRGTPPFDTEGRFELGPDRLPVVQRMESAPVVLAIPRTPMPAAGYPLLLYFHGSGGTADQVVDRGRIAAPGGQPAPGEGPAHVVAAHHIASAGAALPLSPDRLPGASDYAYLNFQNLAAFRDTFRQGVIEQRLLLDALLDLAIPPEALGGCLGPELPQGQGFFRFDPARVVASGQSMGGMYTNLVGATDPRVGAAVPTGAGGFWNFMLLETRIFPGVVDTVAAVFGTSDPDLAFLHPALHLIGLAWEAAEPFAFMPRLARRPLPGHPVRPIYQPVGDSDAYFPPAVYDAAALAYGHQQAGEEVWPEMQEALALAGLDGVAGYPVISNMEGEDGAYTGVVVQYEPDGVVDGHYIFAQRDEVKFQYGCFLASFLAGGAVVHAPGSLDGPCH
jgi:hypothetical protein